MTLEQERSPLSSFLLAANRDRFSEPWIWKNAQCFHLGWLVCVQFPFAMLLLNRDPLHPLPLPIPLHPPPPPPKKRKIFPLTLFFHEVPWRTYLFFLRNSAALPRSWKPHLCFVTNWVVPGSSGFPVSFSPVKRWRFLTAWSSILLLFTSPDFTSLGDR